MFEEEVVLVFTDLPEVEPPLVDDCVELAHRQDGCINRLAVLVDDRAADGAARVDLDQIDVDDELVLCRLQVLGIDTEAVGRRRMGSSDVELEPKRLLGQRHANREPTLAIADTGSGRRHRMTSETVVA